MLIFRSLSSDSLACLKLTNTPFTQRLKGNIYFLKKIRYYSSINFCKSFEDVILIYVQYGISWNPSHACTFIHSNALLISILYIKNTKGRSHIGVVSLTSHNCCPEKLLLGHTLGPLFKCGIFLRVLVCMFEALEATRYCFSFASSF